MNFLKQLIGPTMPVPSLSDDVVRQEDVRPLQMQPTPLLTPQFQWNITNDPVNPTVYNTTKAPNPSQQQRRIIPNENE